jgi:hypothetical protein
MFCKLKIKFIRTHYISSKSFKMKTKVFKIKNLEFFHKLIYLFSN